MLGHLQAQGRHPRRFGEKRQSQQAPPIFCGACGPMQAQFDQALGSGWRRRYRSFNGFGPQHLAEGGIPKLENLRIEYQSKGLGIQPAGLCRQHVHP